MLYYALPWWILYLQPSSDLWGAVCVKIISAHYLSCTLFYISCTLFIYRTHYLYGLTTASLHEKSGSLCTYVRIWFLTFRPTARTLVTSNADWSWKMRASCDSQCARPSSSSGVACWSLTVGWHFSRFSPFFLTVFQPWFQPTKWNFCQLYRISEFN